jgi:ABC-type glycerol-3-phosphate transport system substrate-binding protein
VPEDFQPASVLYFNKSLLDKAGEKPPTQDMAWPQFLELARRLTKGSGDVADQYGYAFPKWTYEQFVYNFGGQTVDNVENPTKCLLDSSQAIQGLEFMVDLQHKYKVMPSPQIMTQANLASENNWFLAGRLATLNSGTWTTGTWNQSKENLDWGMTLAPKGQDGKWHYATGGAGWAIPSEAKNPDASWEWMRWQFGPAGWRVWLSKRDPKTFWLPAIRSLAEEDAKRLEKLYPNASVVVKSADYIWFRPGGARWEKANGDILSPVINDLHQNKVPVRAAIQDAVQRVNAVLAWK